MLGGKEPYKPTLEPIDPSKVRSMRGSSMRASGSDFRKSARGGAVATPSLQSIEKLDSGTPQKGVRKDGKRADTMRQSGKSVGKFANTKMGSSHSNFGDAKSVKTGSVRDAKDDSFDLEDFEDIMEKIQLDGALEEQQRVIKKVRKTDNDDYKDNFLVKFFEGQGDFFNIDGEGSLSPRKNRTRIPVPPTQEEIK